MLRAKISGVHGYVPDDILSNADLEKMVDTNDEWITTRTGIKERRILKGEGQGFSVIGQRCIEGLLEKTGCSPEEIDLVICCTITPDMVFPATANILANKCGLTNAWGFDLKAACSGFIYGLTTGAKFIETGFHKKVIVIGGDKMSSMIDYQDRATCIIFGDGGGAVLLEASEDECGVIDSVLYSDGAGAEFLHQKAGGSNKPASHETVDAREHYVFQDGKQVFKHAVVNMAEAGVQIMDRNQLKSDDIDWLVPHQANKRIIDATRDRMGVLKKK